jgi:hypothetical protein
MLDTVQFLAKILLFSLLISVLIKYVAPHWSVPATASVSLVLVLLPMLLMASWLAWQQWQR